MVLTTLSLALASYGYVLQGPVHGASALRAPAASMALRISGVNVDVTDALRAHAEAKLNVPLEKFASVLNDAKDPELHMKVEGGGVHDEKHVGRVSHKAELTAYLKGKARTVVVSSDTEDMYATIDELEALLARQLRKAKEKWADKKVASGAKGKDKMEAEAVADDSLTGDSPAVSGTAPAGFTWGNTY